MQASDVERVIPAVGSSGGSAIEDFHVELDLLPGFEGHMVADEVVSDVNDVNDAPKCNRPPQQVFPLSP